MARRAAALASLRNEGIPALVLAGPGEFLQDRIFGMEKDFDHAVMAQVQRDLAAYLRYDCLYVSPKAEAWFRNNGGALPASGVLVGAEPVVREFVIAEKRLGVALLPYGTTRWAEPTDEQIDEALTALRSLQGRVDLVIAVSPWGLQAESEIALRFQGEAHLLLGGGSGSGVPGQVFPPGLLWARAESAGRGLVVIDFLQWPQPMQPLTWLEGINFRARDVPLGVEYSDDPEIRRILAPFNKDIQ